MASLGHQQTVNHLLTRGTPVASRMESPLKAPRRLATQDQARNQHHLHCPRPRRTRAPRMSITTCLITTVVWEQHPLTEKGRLHLLNRTKVSPEQIPRYGLAKWIKTEDRDLTTRVGRSCNLERAQLPHCHQSQRDGKTVILSIPGCRSKHRR